MNFIFDTTALDAIYKLDIVNYLGIVANRILIPVKVEAEFLAIRDVLEQNKRAKFLFEIYQSRLFEKCTSYSLSSVELLMQEFEKSAKKEKIHAGECEVIIQYNTIKGGEEDITMIIDDKAARDYAKRNEYTINGTLTLLARADVSLSLNKYDQWIRDLNNQGSRYGAQIAIEVLKRERERQGLPS